MRPISICLIGCGPRGLITLNALRRHIIRESEKGLTFKISIIEPNTPGVGCHDPNQPDYLYTNTLASQLTAFFPRLPDGEDDGWLTGPSFTEWARLAGIRSASGRFDQFETGDTQSISELDYLPRSLLGRYLAWSFRTIADSFPGTATILIRKSTAQDITENGSLHSIALADGTNIDADFVILSTGHSTNRLSSDECEIAEFVQAGRKFNPGLAYFPHAYPTTELDRIPETATVAVQGFGLTAWDVIAQLTEGRGGKYVSKENNLSYNSSGYEPEILIFSRSCQPFAARGVNQKGLTGRHSPLFFTTEAISALRKRISSERSNGQIDFREQALPLLLKEMAYAYRCAALTVAPDPSEFEPSEEELGLILAEFDLFEGSQIRSHDEFSDLFIRTVERDLSEADRGNLASPIKAATDVIRDCRSALCSAAEFSGLTPESDKWFREVLAPQMNRMSFGPPKFRNEQLLALLRSGTVQLGGGPKNRLHMDRKNWRYVIETHYQNNSNNMEADVLVSARLDIFRPEVDDREITRSMMSRGFVRPLLNGTYRPGGYDITRDHRAIGSSGQASDWMWILGYPAEGARFYTHAIPRAGLPSGQHADADHCVRSIFERVKQRWQGNSAGARQLEDV